MRHLAALVVVLAACTEDLSHQPVIPQGGRVNRPATREVPKTWKPGLCRVEPTDASAAEGISFSGECNWTLAEPVACNGRDDDFYILAIRTLPGGREFRFYVNVERYHGPGDYPALGQAQVTLRDGATLYRWMDPTATISLLGEGTGDKASVKSVRLSSARMAAEPGTPTDGIINAGGALPCAPPLLPIQPAQEP